MNLKKLKERGASFVQYTVILAFAMVIGMFFISDKSLSNTIDEIFGEGADVLAVAIGNEPTHNGGNGGTTGGGSGGATEGGTGGSSSGATEGGTGGSSSGATEGGTGGSSSEGGSEEPPKPFPEDNPNFGQTQLEGSFGNTTLGNLGRNGLDQFFNEYRSQFPLQADNQPYQLTGLDYISWNGDKVTVAFKPVGGSAPDPVEITMNSNSNFTNYINNNGIKDKGTLAIDNGGQVVQYNSDKTVYSSLEILNKSGTEYVHYGY